MEGRSVCSYGILLPLNHVRQKPPTARQRRLALPRIWSLVGMDALGRKRRSEAHEMNKTRMVNRITFMAASSVGARCGHCHGSFAEAVECGRQMLARGRAVGRYVATVDRSDWKTTELMPAK